MEEKLEFRIVVWNLGGLSRLSNPDRLQRAREAFRVIASNSEIVAFALVELGSKPDSILEELANHLGDGWTHHFGAVKKGNLEIGLLLKSEYLSATPLPLKTLPHYPNGSNIKIGREPAALFQVEQNENPVFLLAVVHFKAEAGGADHYTRKSLAVWLRNELENFYDATLPVVIVGDFNGEPSEEMFGPEGFRAFRRTDATLRSRDSLKLYNPMWKLLPDPVTVTERNSNRNHQKSMPYGTFPAEIWHSLIDGVLVSGEWLSLSKYVLHDERLEILTDDLWHHIGSEGAHHARPKGIEKELAITDHLPLAVNLEIK